MGVYLAGCTLDCKSQPSPDAVSGEKVFSNRNVSHCMKRSSTKKPLLITTVSVPCDGLSTSGVSSPQKLILFSYSMKRRPFQHFGKRTGTH